MTGVGAVLVAPFVEEVFFRGFLYRTLRNRLGIASASATTGLLFGLIHTNYPLLVRPELACFGVIAALLYECTGSLLPGIAMHSIINASGFEYSLSGRISVTLSASVVVAAGLLLRSLVQRVDRVLVGQSRPSQRGAEPGPGGANQPALRRR